jgi:nucleotide-binding universal stress UspA family protein
MRILLATDGSEHSENAARFLTRINWSPQDAITVFHAIYAIPFPEDRKFHFDTLTSVKKEIAPSILDSATAILKPVQAGISVEIGELSPGEYTPDQSIMNAARASKADLIVMGARGTKGIASAFLGSVTRVVTARSPLPVLVVKRTEKHSPGPLKILFAADGSAYSRAAGEFLSSISFPDDAEVTILHALASGFSDLPERFSLELNDRIKETVANARDSEFAESEKILEEARTSLSKKFRAISILSKAGDPSEEIVGTATSGRMDIIVVGCRGLRGMKGMMGSVSKNVLIHAPCSVLIGKTCGG